MSDDNWENEAREEQQGHFSRLGDRLWDEISSGEWTILKQKVGYGLYGPPPELPSDDNKHTGYSGEKLERIEELSGKLTEPFNFQKEEIHFACFYIVVRLGETSHTLPIFKSKAVGRDCIYVDTWARVYNSWGDWLDHEKLPQCWYCAPSGGYYHANSENEVNLIFREANASGAVSKTVDALDVTSTVLSVGATALGVASLFVPVAGPVLFATAITASTTGAYSVGRSTYELVDRGKHGQSISLADREARGHWLSIVGSSVGAGLGLAQGRLIASMSASARTGEVMGRAGRIAFAAAQIGSLTINGLGIVHGLENLVHRIEKDELTPLDVFQFTASVLFFTNAAVNFKTAGSIIKQVQQDTLEQNRVGMTPKAKKLFNKHTGQLRGPDEMHGNAQVIKNLNNIENVQQLYEMMVDKNVDNSRVKMVPYKETNLGFKGQLRINKDLRIHPLKLQEIRPESRQVIYDSSRIYTRVVGDVKKEVAAKKIDQVTADTRILKASEKHHANVAKVCSEYRIKFESMHEKTMNNLCKLFGKSRVNDIQVGGKKIFAQLSGHQKSRVYVVLEKTLKNDPDLVRAATEFAESRGCKTFSEFVSCAEFLAQELLEKKSANLKQYHEMRTNGTPHPEVETHFNIEGKWNKHAEKQACSDFTGARRQEAFRELSQKFDRLKAEIGPLNKASATGGFTTDDLAVYHYAKHKYFEKIGELTPEDYFNLADQVVGNDDYRSGAMLSQDGSCVMIEYRDPENGAMAVMIEKFSEDGRTSGLATLLNFSP